MGGFDGGSGGCGYHNSPSTQRQEKKKEFKEFDDLIGLIKSEKLEDRRIFKTSKEEEEKNKKKPSSRKKRKDKKNKKEETEKIPTEEKVILTYFKGHYELTSWQCGDSIPNRVVCLGKTKDYNNRFGIKCKEVMAVDRKKETLFALSNKKERNSIFAKRKEHMIEIEEEILDSLWEKYTGRKRDNLTKDEAFIYSNSNKEKVKQFLMNITDYLKGELYKPKRMLLRKDQELPAKLKELEKELCAEEFLKTKKTLEQAFKEQTEKQEINNEHDLKKYCEKTRFAKTCGLCTEEAGKKIQEYKTRLKQEFETQTKKIQKEKKEKLKDIDKALENL